LGKSKEFLKEVIEMSEKREKVDPCFLAWVHLFEVLEKEKNEKKEGNLKDNF